MSKSEPHFPWEYTFGESFDTFWERGTNATQHFIKNVPIISSRSISACCGFVPERALLLEHRLIEPEPFRLPKSKVIRQVISDQPTAPDGRVPLESSNVIVPSKSLNTTIFISPAINGIPAKDTRLKKAGDGVDGGNLTLRRNGNFKFISNCD
jgi:hypothetical protein